MKKIFKRVAALSIMAAAVVFDVPKRLLALAADTHTNHKVCVGSSCSDSSHTDISNWVGINDLSNLETGKYYYLTDDVTLSSRIEIKGVNVTLCLNGHTIDGKNVTHIFYLEDNAILTLCDCKGSGKLTGANNTSSFYGGTVFVKKATFIMNGGIISYNTSNNHGKVLTTTASA